MATTGTQVITQAQRILRDTSGRRYTSAILLDVLNDVLRTLSMTEVLVQDNYRIPLVAFQDLYEFPADTFTPLSLYVMPDPLAIQNADFSDSSEWSGTNWTVAAGGATHTTGSTEPLTQSVANVIQRTPWILNITIANRTAGGVSVALSGGTAGASITANGETTQTLTAGSGSTITITPTTDFDGKVTKVRLLRSHNRIGVSLLRKVSRPIVPAAGCYGFPAYWYTDESNLLRFKVLPIPDSNIKQSDLVLTYSMNIPTLALASDTLSTSIPDSVWGLFHYGVAAEALMSSEDTRELEYVARWQQQYQVGVLSRITTMKNTTTDRIVPGRSWRF